MKSGSRSNALLVELLIVVMFFMLSSTVLLQVFATARNQSAQAGRINEALNAAQNTADRLYAAESAEEALLAMGFKRAQDDWRQEGEDFNVTVSCDEEQGTTGTLSRYRVHAEKDGDILVDLPVARYREAQQ